MKIIVGLSGGVDSSVAAALLQRQGHEVIGAFMKNWTDTVDVEGVCDWKNDKRDAQRVAAKLGIPLIVLDYQKEYREQVVDYMFEEYSKGRTPNPDVMCNNAVKFGPFLEAAQRLGADKIATGHYAGVSSSVIAEKGQASQPVIPEIREANYPGYQENVYHLMPAKDKHKDQTYFLHRLNQKQLSKTLFPLAEYTKKEVRQLAKNFDLPTANRKESMGVCFIGDINVREFLKQKIKPVPGDVITVDGDRVGKHEGLAYYTIGQRHGVGSAGGGQPLYVADKSTKTNQLIVAPENHPSLYKTEIQLEDVHWLSPTLSSRRSAQHPTPSSRNFAKQNIRDLTEKKTTLECHVRFRHRQDLQEATLIGNTLHTKKPQRAIAPGQFAVLYKDGKCLGGGVIK